MVAWHAHHELDYNLKRVRMRDHCDLEPIFDYDGSFITHDVNMKERVIIFRSDLIREIYTLTQSQYDALVKTMPLPEPPGVEG